MFERFTDRARRVLALANKEAQRLKHEHLGTEHILLGLVKEGSGAGPTVLKNCGADYPKVSLEVEKLVKSGSDMVTMGKLPQDPRAKRVIEYAIEEARHLDLRYVGTEHFLLGLLREVDGVAAQVLMRLGLKVEDVREEVLHLLHRGHYDNSPAVRAKRAEEFDAPPLVLLLDPGTATAEEIGQLLYEFSTLYRMLGGSGITFTTEDAREPAFA